MPDLTRWLIKTGFIYLAAALSLGVLLAVPQNVALPALIRRMTPAYFHLFLVGWVTQIILGVIYWMFPIITRANPRGNERLGWAGYALLNGGLLLRVALEPLPASEMARGWGWLLAASALMQWVAAVIWVVLAWPRVKERYRGE